MKMKNLINKTVVLTFALLFAFQAQACSSGNDGNENPTSPVVTEPVKPTLTVETIGKTAEKPLGDGSGKLHLTISATDAKSIKVTINSKVIENATGDFIYEFQESGNKDYTIEVTSFNGIKYASTSVTGSIFVARKLIWSDEFDVNGSPNTSKWGYDLGTGNGFGNNELEYYTNRPENVIIDNGILKIKAIKEEYQGSHYTSSRMLTKGKFSFKYGRAEVRAKLPVGGGTWPAFWMLGDNIDTAGWPLCGEIDILESVGNSPNVIHSSLHSPGRSGNTPDTATTTNPTAYTEFHIYAAEWNAENIKFYVDDKLFYTYKNSATTPFNEKFFIILNLAMGGNFGGTVDPNFTSATYEIDYVRVYN